MSDESIGNGIPQEHQVAVVGAGPSGVASALALKDRGIRSVVIEQADQVASSWRGRYDRLRLNTWRAFSHLPDRPFPKGTPKFPTRDQLIEHVESHSREDGIDLRLRTRVEAIDRDQHHWAVSTAVDEITAPQVVVATGYEGRPWIPDWEGREGFGGRVLHACEYRNPGPFRDQAVIVVGAGSSGMEIAQDLTEGGAGKVWLSARTPPNIVMREGPAGLPGDVIATALLHLPARLADGVTRFARRMNLGDLSEHGLPVPDEGAFARLRRLGVAPTILDEEAIAAIKDGRIEVVRGVEALDATGVRLADGARVEPDSVICATGYRCGLEPLVGHLEVLDERGRPKAVGERPAAPGLRFIGFVPRPGGLGYMAKQAKRAAKAIAVELHSGQERR